MTESTLGITTDQRHIRPDDKNEEKVFVNNGDSTVSSTGSMLASPSGKDWDDAAEATVRRK